MTFIGLNSRRPDKRASSLFHLGMEVIHDAKIVEAQLGLRPDQNHVLNIFIGEVKKQHTSILKGLGYDV